MPSRNIIVRFRIALAFALLAGSLSCTTSAWGSIAARVHAATIASKPAAEQLAEIQDGAPTGDQVHPSAIAQTIDDAPPTRVAKGDISATPPPSRRVRINVADWFNVPPQTNSPTDHAVNANSTGDDLAADELTTDEPAEDDLTSDSVIADAPSVRDIPVLIAPILEPAQQPAASSSRRRVASRPRAPLDSVTVEPKQFMGPSLMEDLEPATDAPEADSLPDWELEEPATLSAADGSPIEAHGTPRELQPATDPHLPLPTELQVGGDPEEESAADPEEEAEETSQPEHAAPAKPARQFSPQLLRLRDRNRACLMYYFQRPESVAQRSPWGIMHSLISFGVDTEILAGRDRVNAIGWMCYNRPCRGMSLMQLSGSYPAPRNGPGYQGHEGQFLSMLALSRVKSSYPMRVEGHDFTVADLIEYEKLTCRPKSELTFKLIALAHYLSSDATWTSKWGEKWSIPRLIKEELAQPINGACCGGTHRLIGYSMAVKVRERRGEPVDGQWLRAQKYTDAYHKYVIKLQNRDGSFSTSWLKQRDASGETDRRIQTTGHILEWLVFSLPEDELTDPRIVSAINYLSSTMLNHRQREWEIGPRGHALRALALYNERVFGDKPGERRALLARRPKP